MGNVENKIGCCLWFDTQTEDAAKFYTSIFNNSKIGKINRYGKEGQEIPGKPEGSVMTVDFQLENQHFVGLNGGPVFKLNPSISFFINRDTKEKIHALWEKLSKDGEVLRPLDSYPFSECYGWVKDKFGVSWQLILGDKEGDWRPPIVPCLLFGNKHYGNAEGAMNFYLSVFKNSKQGQLEHYGPDQSPNEEGTVMFSDFSLEGQWFVAMDGGGEHEFEFNEAISFIVNCDTQEEVDYYWKKLSSDPSAEQCGWLRDKFGIFWQIVPKVLSEMLNDKDTKKSQAVMKAMLQMKKLKIADLKKAYKS